MLYFIFFQGRSSDVQHIFSIAKKLLSSISLAPALSASLTLTHAPNREVAHQFFDWFRTHLVDFTKPLAVEHASTDQGEYNLHNHIRILEKSNTIRFSIECVTLSWSFIDSWLHSLGFRVFDLRIYDSVFSWHNISQA